ncbi:MAG TPA: hypothetical protein VLN59_05100 [Burkholderiales bacterium]|nr:hypothetical protein [Burkholderiales bacterium]
MPHDLNKEAATGEDVERFTPVSLTHATQVALLLHQHYSDRTSDECREAVAAMYGHPDWGALEAAVQAARETSRFDEEVDAAVVARRRDQQYDIVLRRLAGMTDDVMVLAQELDQELLSTAHDSIAQRYDPRFNERRMQRARYAFNIAYARHVIDEVRPTARQRASIPEDEDDINLGMRVDLLPRALEAWLTHHRPLLKGPAVQLGKVVLRQRAATDLIRFAFRWGELCLFHAIDIPQALQIYPIALCSMWYGWAVATGRSDLSASFAALHQDGVADEAVKAAETTIERALHEEEARFILAQPRADFRTLSASAREQQMRAGHAILRHHMKDAASEYTIKHILAKPFFAAMAHSAPRTTA